MNHGLDLSNLSVDQLIELNRDVVDRVKILRQKESYMALARFNIGDRVFFESNMGTIKGIIVKLNKKTATIHSDDHRHWNVSPHFLKKIMDGRNHDAEFTNIISVQRG